MNALALTVPKAQTMRAALVAARIEVEDALAWLRWTAVTLWRDQRGNMTAGMSSIIFGVLVLVVGLILSDLVLSQVGEASAKLSEDTGSDVDHSSAQSINSLLPILYYIGLITLALGMIGAGGYATYRGHVSS